MRFGVFSCFFGFSELSAILLSINSIKLQAEKKDWKERPWFPEVTPGAWLGRGKMPRPEPRARGFIVTSLHRPFRKHLPLTQPMRQSDVRDTGPDALTVAFKHYSMDQLH